MSDFISSPFINDPITAVTDRFSEFRTLSGVRLRYVSELLQDQIFGRVIPLANHTYEVEICPFLNVLDTAVIVAHELAHVLDLTFNGRLWRLTRHDIASLKSPEPDWAHDSLWQRWYDTLSEPLSHRALIRRGIDKSFVVAPNVLEENLDEIRI